MSDLEREDALAAAEARRVGGRIVHLAVMAGDPVPTNLVPRQRTAGAQQCEVLPRIPAGGVGESTSEEALGEDCFGQWFVLHRHPRLLRWRVEWLGLGAQARCELTDTTSPVM